MAGWGGNCAGNAGDVADCIVKEDQVHRWIDLIVLHEGLWKADAEKTHTACGICMRMYAKVEHAKTSHAKTSHAKPKVHTCWLVFTPAACCAQGP